MKACFYLLSKKLDLGILYQLSLLCMLTGLCQVSSGQGLASLKSKSKLSINQKPVEQQKALSQVLSELEKMHHIIFVYENRLINDKYVLEESIKNKGVDEIFEIILPQFGLKHKKIGGNVYSIGPVKKDESRQVPMPLNKDNSNRINPKDLKISGKVINDLGEEMIGVTVVLKGTTVGTRTDANGNYSLTSQDGNGTLVFSYVGYQQKEVPINNRTIINVSLNIEAASLEEVLVVGYGEQSKSIVTGSQSSVKTKDIETIKSADLASGLAGKLPGLRVKQNSSEPGSYRSTFDIRGFGAPLIVVDGMVMENRDFARLNPNTIENITILKDASAAVYGVKAANGVVLVTTKKGEISKPTVTYSGNYALLKFTETPEPMNIAQFAEYSTEIEINSGRGPNETTYRPEDLQRFRDGVQTGTNWYDLVTRDYTSQQTHNVSVSGGSDKTRYFTSFGYVNEMGMWKSGDLNYKKYNIRTNITSQISDNLEMELKIDGLMDQKNEPGAPAFIKNGIGGIYFSLFMQDPTVPIYANNTMPYLSDTYDGQHPLAITNADIGGYTKTGNRTFQGTYSLNYKVPFIKGLSAKFRYGYYNLEELEKIWKPKYLMYRYDAVSDTYINSATKNDPVNMTGNYTNLQRSTLLGQFNYNTSLDHHNIQTALIYEERITKSDDLWAKSEFDANVDQFFAGTKNQQVSSNKVYENRNKSIISRLTYDFARKYLFEAGFNFGGSSLFPANKRWGFFPYASAGWRISEEGFFKNALPIITNLKLRGSLGQMGDDRAAAFQFLSGYTYPSGNYIFNNQVVPGLGFRGLPNPDITWSTVTSKNIGFEMELKRGLLNIEFDLFRRDRKGLLTTRALTLPGTVGVNLPQENLNKDMRRGFELVVGHSKKIGNVDYHLSSNITYSRGQATHIERSPYNNSLLNWQDNKTNRWDNITWGYEVLGQFQNYEEIFSSPLQGNLTQGNRFILPGDLKYKDINNDGVIDDMDSVPIGKSTTPDVNLGLSGGLKYKQFDIDFLLQGAAGFNYIDGNWFDRGLQWLGRNGLSKFYDRWHRADPYDVNSEWIPGRFPSAYVGSGANPSRSNRVASEFWVRDAKYLRLKSLELGYTINKTLLTKTGIKSLRLNVSGTNLLTWTGLKDVDPERGDQLNYPITRMYNFGVNLQF